AVTHTNVKTLNLLLGGDVGSSEASTACTFTEVPDADRVTCLFESVLGIGAAVDDDECSFTAATTATMNTTRAAKPMMPPSHWLTITLTTPATMASRIADPQLERAC